MIPDTKRQTLRVDWSGVFLLIPLIFSACQNAGPPAAEMHIEAAWARPARGMPVAVTSPDSTTAAPSTSAVYMTLRNTGGSADTLRGARASVAEAVEIHESRTEDGIMRMRQVGRIVVEPGQSVRLQPGGYHLMLVRLRQDLGPGDSISVSLEFAKSGERAVLVGVREP